MRNLKKLSAAFMLAALFSVSFTSCIDNEVSPIVEAIYEAQADLIAAQARVQDAEAALREARANAENALAELRLSEAAENLADAAATAAETTADVARWAEELRKLIADNNHAIALAEIALQDAQLDWQILMAQLLHDLAQVGATEAAGYLTKYNAAMALVNNDTNALLTKQGELTFAELLLNGTPLTATATLQSFIDAAQASIAAKNATIASETANIAAYEAAMANPTAIETQINGLKTQVSTLMDRKDDLIADIALAQQDVNAANDAIADVTAFMTTEYPAAASSLATWKANHTADLATITAQNTAIASLNAIIANYDGTKATLKAAFDAATANVGGVAGSHPTNHAPGYGLLGAIETQNNLITTLTTALGVYGVAPVYADVPRTGTKPQDVKWNADLALLKHNTDFAALVVSYNNAAAALATAQTTFGSTAGPLATAQTAQIAATAALVTAQGAYTTAKTAFEAAPNGSVHTDSNLTNVDGGILGIPADANVSTFRRVATWKESPFLSGNYVPDTFYPTNYVTTAAVTAAYTALDGTATESTLGVYDTSPGAGTQVAQYYVATPLTLAQVRDAVSIVGFVNITEVYYVDVEADDTFVSNLYTFNVAANMRGVDFANRPFFTAGLGTIASPYTFNTVLISTMADAGYDSTPDANGLTTPAGDANNDMLTAQAVLWNANLEVFKKQNAADLGAAGLAAAQAVYDYQKGLFDNGVATTATLTNAVTAAALTVTNANNTITAANTALTKLQNELGTNAWYAGRLFTTTSNLPISWDAHDNDGYTTPIFDILTTAPYAWDSALPAGVDSLTAYAALWNAENAYKDHIATSLTTYKANLATAQATLNTATLEAAEDLIYIAKFQADVDALQARYDALLLTPLYAALNVTLVNAQQAKAVLVAEDIAIDGMLENYLGTSYTSTAPTVPVAGPGLIADLKNHTAFTDWAAKIAAAKTNRTNAQNAIPGLEITLELAKYDLYKAINVTIEQIKADILELELRIAVNQAMADKWKALFDAAIVS